MTNPILHILLLISVLIVGVSSLKDATPKGPNRFPFLATIWAMPDEQVWWTGTIIGPRNIVTVGHKFHELTSTGNESIYFSICVGAEKFEDMTNDNPRVQWRHHVAFLISPDFVVVPAFAHTRGIDSYQSDMAMIQFEERLQYGPDVDEIAVTEINFSQCARAEVIGWRKDTYAQEKGYIKNNLLPAQVCEHLGVYVLKNELCARNADLRGGFTEGDVGSPIVYNGNYLGMVVDTHHTESDEPWLLLMVGPYLQNDEE